MSFALHGLAVSQGIAIGHAHLVSHATLEVARYTVRERDIPREIERFEKALAAVRSELGVLHAEAVTPGSPSELAALVNVHAMFLNDPLLAEVPKDLMRERGCNAEWALVQQMEHLVAQFEEIDDSYLRERKHDIVQVVERVLRVLLDKPRRHGKRGGYSELVIVAHDLSPADTIQFKNLKIAGFVTDLGGATSHTAIVARSLAIPAVVGLHHARPLVREGDLIIVDGTRGVLIVDPGERVLEEYQLKKRELELERSKLKRLKTARSATLDNVDISLQANIELPQDIVQVKEAGADGVGLFRTEFLFMNRDTLPSEDEQFEAYRMVAKSLAGKPLTIRTLDLGADKTARALHGTERQSPNPALGLRAIRYCLAEPQLFLAQLRAILRASHVGNVQILIPMLAHVTEVEQTLAMIEQAKQQLRERRCKFNEHIPVGGMIEIPAAALALGALARRLQFLSIGTNDLIQYTLAIDRTDEAVAHLYDPLHPAILRLISHVIQTAQRAEIPVAVCGEMGGDPKLTRLLLGMGLRQFSMHPTQLLEVKQQVVMADTEQLSTKVTRLLRLDEPERIRELVERL
ncbi:MAG: phosphoenolpyruvate--protein phosphotransferase [Gammaproteobacteria bacterium]|nr:phosphoenolpyruvate--protein phosphotransferase [Rhodocyclaceae bacterium]MBU3910254.1 phosphoenolpyruvate--protein phosphotransferase [Gammaproteobacteria bacterium]MBU3989449.1 phosphoenolpyruvate--protein phosphotransferase [Gammaproteobacteria bacterium]MBU4005424.1 phosphoenolpyruvate--protein phosphotransferase [Gammaproteobacteria bacterium]MBU4022716.1 phosphoenolpyruvate--protein phosphotransferase [Gammaproteobacteria bacterium]